MKLLKRCLAALSVVRLPPGAKLQVIVVDNGSRDGSPEWLGAQTGAEALIFREPLGFAHANNAARRIARGDVIAFLNNDTEVDPDWLLRPLTILAGDRTVVAVGSKLVFMHRFMKITFRLGGGKAFVLGEHYGTALDSKARWAGLPGTLEVRRGRAGRWVKDGDILYLPVPEPDLDGPQDRSPAVIVSEVEGTETVVLSTGARDLALGHFPGLAVIDVSRAARPVRLVQNAGSFLTLDAEGGDVGTGVEDGPDAYGSEAEVPAICGAAFFARRSALDAAGWFPEYYTMYYEDTDLCLRLRQAGGRLVYCPSSIAYHYHTGTNREYSPRFIENVARSNLLFAARFGDARLLARKLRERLGYVRAELGGSGGRGLRERWSSAHGTRGTIGALRALPRVLAERSWDVLRHHPGGPALLGAPRTPYTPEVHE